MSTLSANGGGGGFTPTYAATKALAHWGCGSTIRAYLIGVTLIAGPVSCHLYRNVPNVLVPGTAHAAVVARRAGLFHCSNGDSACQLNISQAAFAAVRAPCGVVS